MLTLSHIQTAAGCLAPHAGPTPIMRSSVLDRIAGARLFFKCENLQRAGAFKFRGAGSAVFSLDDTAVVRGVATHSSGNHGAALALAAQLRGIPAHIVIPKGASAAKVAAVERYGGRITRCAVTMKAREMATAEVIAETGATFVHPYNDLQVMAGQGTTALEFLAQVPELDTLLVPVSGGGLISGCAVAATELRPGIRVIGVEPAGADDAARSLAAGAIVREPEPDTICDGLRAYLGSLTFEIIRERVSGIVTVTDAETAGAMRMIWEILKLVVEPSGAVGLAAVLSRQFVPAPSGRVGIVLSGGNADLDQLPWSKPKGS